MTTKALRVVEYHALVFRRQWLSAAITSFLTPLLYLGAIGLGVGSLMANPPIEGVSYAAYLAPGLMASTAMVVATLESTWPVLSAIRWNRQYHAMLAAPLGPASVVAGHLVFVAVRVVLATAALTLAAMVFPESRDPRMVLAIAPAVLTGLAFAAPITAFATTITDLGNRFASLQRFVIIPMFLFAGTFYPIDQLPPALQVVARLTPLWHGVELCRGVVLGGLTAAEAAVHVGFLTALAVVGYFLAVAGLRRRLLV